MELVALDLGAYVRHAREAWGYRKVVLAGWLSQWSVLVRDVREVRPAP